jgi:hypothetical protein
MTSRPFPDLLVVGGQLLVAKQIEGQRTIDNGRRTKMITPTAEQIERLKEEWTDKMVTVNAARPELKRFEGRVGRVVTVNWSGKALVDFCDGGWYDIAASADSLTVVDAETAKKYDATANSAQPRPDRQG